MSPLIFVKKLAKIKKFCYNINILKRRKYMKNFIIFYYDIGILTLNEIQEIYNVIEKQILEKNNGKDFHLLFLPKEIGPCSEWLNNKEYIDFLMVEIKKYCNNNNKDFITILNEYIKYAKEDNI